MKAIFGMFLAFAAGLVLLSGANGQGGKEVTIKGDVTCAKCGLNKEKTCMTVVVEKKDKMDTVYYFDAETHKKYHGDVCTATKAGTVTGTVTEKDGKKTIAVKDLKYSK
jgi:hypothetical protein